MLAEAMCLSMVMYLEARGEGIEGMRDMGGVVIARAHDKRWPNHVCQVVTQNKMVKTNKTKHVDDYGQVYYTYDQLKVCQFEPFCAEGDLLSSLRNPAKMDAKAWENSEQLAEEMLAERDKYKNGPKWFVADWTKQPKWTENLCLAKHKHQTYFYKDCDDKLKTVQDRYASR